MKYKDLPNDILIKILLERKKILKNERIEKENIMYKNNYNKVLNELKCELLKVVICHHYNNNHQIDSHILILCMNLGILTLSYH